MTKGGIVMNDSTIAILFLVFAMISFFLEKIPVWTTAIIVLIGYIVTGVLTPSEAFAGFTNSSVLLFMAMFIVGDALFVTGAATKIGALVTKYAKTEKQAILLIILTSGLLSGFLSNTGTAAIYIPIVMGICKSSGYSKKRLLMPIVVGVGLGGSLTLLGTPPNLIASGQLEAAGLQGFGVFEFTPVALPLFIAGMIFYAIIGVKLLPEVGNESETNNSAASIYDQDIDFSNVPKFREYMAYIIMIVTIIAMVLN